MQQTTSPTALPCGAKSRRLVAALEQDDSGLHCRWTKLRSSPRKRRPRAELSAKELGPRFRGDERS